LDLLRARNVPFMARPGYVREAWHLLPWGVVAGMAEGNVAGVVVSKTFQGSDLLIAIAVAAPLFAKLVSLVWGLVCVGRRKLRVLTLLASASTLCMLSVAMTPHTPLGGILFVAQMATAQIFLSGVVTVRTGLWKSNYPPEYRGQITARLQLVRLIPSIAATAAAAQIFDRDPAAYRFVYPLTALCGLVAIHLLQRVRVRGEASEIRQALGRPANGLSPGLAEPFTLVAMLSPGNVIGRMIRVLREDARFARYCGALMLIGAGNLMIGPVLLVIVTQELALGYLVSLSLLEMLPRGLMMVSLYRWAPYFDRVGVVRFRVANGACWFSFLALGTLAALVVVFRERIGPPAPALAVALFTASAVARGLGFGSGALAWNLGHLHFARRQDAEVYMGVHVTLTGLRGLIMPLLGIWLWTHTGLFAWILATSLSALGLLGYVAMARAETPPKR